LVTVVTYGIVMYCDPHDRVLEWGVHIKMSPFIVKIQMDSAIFWSADRQNDTIIGQRRWS